jgi:hypothetical protein
LVHAKCLGTLFHLSLYGGIHLDRLREVSMIFFTVLIAKMPEMILADPAATAGGKTISRTGSEN